MVQPQLSVRFAAGLLIVPFAALPFFVDCGGSDTIDLVDASLDATLPDANLSDRTLTDRGLTEVDAELDAVVDAEVDVGIDAAVDAEVDASLDAGLDAEVDAALDAALDGDAGGILPNTILGAATSFAILGGSTITNVGIDTLINGNLGLNPGTSSGVPNTQIQNGTTHINDSEAIAARGAATTAFGLLDGINRPCAAPEAIIDLGGRTLPPGVYCFSSTAGLTGELFLDASSAPDPANAEWVFQVGSSLTTAAGAPGAPEAKVTMLGGGSGCNVYWRIIASATINDYTEFKGNVLTGASIDVKTGATVSPGRLLASISGAVTLISNTVSRAGCP